MSARNFLKALCIGMFLLILSPLGVYACTAIYYKTLEERVTSAPIIVIGTVLSAEHNRAELWTEADIQVETYLKGQGAALIHVANFSAGSDCRSPANIGEHAIFYIEGNPYSGYLAFNLGGSDAVAEASPETINAIVSMTGQSVLPENTPLTVQLAYAWQLYGNWFLGMAAAVSVLAYLGIRRFSKSARKKKKNDSL